MSYSGVCAVILLIIAVAADAGLIHANQTVCLDLSSKPKKDTTITCNDATITKLENQLLAHLNDYDKSITDSITCEFLSAGSPDCSTLSIKFKIVLTCVGDRPNGDLINNVKKQQMAITNIMERRSSETFAADGVTIIVRLFRESDRRNSPKPTCSEECSEIEQGPLILCDCPSIDVPKPSCNIPAVLVRLSKVKTISGQSSCDQVDPSMYSADQQIRSLISKQSFRGLQLQLATNDVKNSSNCTTVDGQVHLSLETSVIVNADTPHCGNNITCIQQFNAKQLATIKSFFIALRSLIGDCVVTVTLWCGNGTVLTDDGQCCAPGCDMCENEPVDVALAVDFNVNQLSAITCSQLNFSQVNTTTIGLLANGANLVAQAGGKLLTCGYPVVNCTVMGGGVNSIVANVLLRLTLAPDVTVSTKEELTQLIDSYIRGFIVGAKASVGESLNITAENFSVEIINGTTECLTIPEHCQPGSYLINGSCQLCPIGQYTDQPNQSTCLHCPDGQTTNFAGATSINQCIDILKPCPKGHYSITGFTPCTPCAVGYYQGASGQTSCVKCPTGYSTVNNGSTGLLDCSVVSTISPPPLPIRMYPTVILDTSYFTSPNYPNNYPVLEKRSYQLICSNSNHSVGLFVLDLSLGDGDSLIIHTERYDGPVEVTIPEPKMFSSQSVIVTFVSDGSSTSRGFRLVYGCYITQYANVVRQLSSDCNVRKYIKNNDRVINKILKVISGEVAFTTISEDPDLAPLRAVLQNGKAQPC